MSAKPTFQDFRIYSEGLVAVKMQKTCIEYNRPMIIEMCILDLSKVLMYDFHYNHIKEKYGEKENLLFTDTDSLCYRIETEDVYQDMAENKTLYDFSDYNKSHHLFDESNKKVIDKMKD